ncbi:PREDICTED: nuclear envelope integral membrane protein 1-like [Amphimedon queenslandica]|uniref:Nuclear envelope integral membrane protein 1 n=1 Tax=Amphimedon queenslandica TaxID=400682 RepID=A0A1X7VBB2_AMPQE|nr:PREDICTED: nuclear envelope integral membrane protein 1-like [Amphimedon queenslandica]|eukprot:XP_019849687.1 PREDICTED: nuclear envelope integral membrane protein 1-like [Amphimedon queenslandica]
MGLHPVVLILACFTVSLLVHGGQPPDESPQKWSDTCSADKCVTIDLSHKNEIIVQANRIYCIKPLKRLSLKGLLYIWHRTDIRLNGSKGSVLVNANSTEFVIKSIKDKETGSGGSFWQQSHNGVSVLKLSPFDTNCVGVKDSSPAKIGGKGTVAFSRRLLIYYPILLLVALLLFYSAPKLTRNPKFYYSSGILIGILASILVLLYIFSKLVPKKNIIGISVLLGGYSFAAYFTHWIYSQGIDFIRDNWLYLLIYLITSGFISFAILYRIGPAHVRTLQLIQWLLQFISLTLLFFSFSQIQVIAFIAVLVLLVHYNTSLFSFVLGPPKELFFRMFLFLQPNIQKKLLTVEEYEEQGRVETEKALKELRKYCRSNPEFWDNKLVNINNQSRLLDFMSGKDHVPNSEKESHDRVYSSWYDDSDDDDDDDDIDSSTASPQVSSSYNSPSPSPRHQQYHHYYYN